MHRHNPGKPILPARQLDVLIHMALGNTYQQTARALDISVNTVKSSLQKTKDKLGARGLAHAVALAFRKGLLNLEMVREAAIPCELVPVREQETLLEQVVAYMARGYVNKEIGVALGFSEQRVKNFVMSITRELGARNRVHLVTLALILGLLDFKNLSV